MPWSTKRKADLYQDLDILLDDLCREWGFCNHLTAADLIPAGTALSATEFACAVLEAEGMNPDYEVSWMRQIRDRIRRAVWLGYFFAKPHPKPNLTLYLICTENLSGQPA